MHSAEAPGRRDNELVETGWTVREFEAAAREALASERLQLEYQPIVSLERDAVAGYEALLRWTDRTRGPVPAEGLVQAAERTGLIAPLGRRVLERACTEAAAWAHGCTVAVNVSPLQFQQDNLLATIESCLARSGLVPERLELEVTEGVLLEDSHPVLETMIALRGAGIGIVLDDFGAGHAGLSYLRRFPFDKLKIDRSYIRNVGRDRASDAFVEAILLLARRLDIQVVAEGVEEPQQLQALRALGCGFAQGYLLGKPLPAQNARAL